MFIEIVTEEERSVLEYGQSSISYRRLGKEKLQELIKKNRIWKGKDRAGSDIYETNDDRLGDDMIDYIITGWSNVKYPPGHAQAGEDVACERQFKIKLPPDIRAILIQKAGGSATENVGAEAEKKTCESSSSTSPTREA
jgi:hypothetical protein